MKRALSIVGCLALLVVGLLPGHVAGAEPDKPTAQEAVPAGFQDDIYVKPRKKGVTPGERPSSTAQSYLEWRASTGVLSSGHPDQLRDDLQGNIVIFAAQGSDLDAMTFTVSGVDVTLTRNGSRLDWNFSDQDKKKDPCKHSAPGDSKACTKDGIPGWLMGHFTGKIWVRHQGEKCWVPLADDEEVHLKTNPIPQEGQ
jgi:hypothetical protein